MICFSPGPSKVYDKIEEYLQDAFSEGILSISHRGRVFTGIYENTITLMKEKLAIPDDYLILFASSATECWEIIAQSLVEQSSFHFYNGAFGQRWFDYTKKIRPAAQNLAFNTNDELDFATVPLPDSAEVVCITQNETSNGTAITGSQIARLKKECEGKLLAVDVTSSLGGIRLPISEADIWLASIQKCFGLPAGLGLLICSPKAAEKAFKINDRSYYNSLPFIIENAKKFQTGYTPNVLTIYLLMRVMQDIDPVTIIHEKLKQRAKEWHELLSKSTVFRSLVKNEAVRSQTIIAVEGNKNEISSIKNKAEQQGIILGRGYGELSETTFRIANFPAIREDENDCLISFFKEYCKI